ncbi:histidine phosphatase family protein [Pseudomonas sp. Marseille-P9899]|uniref:histidine phosphatase family protein n=1 Tax=Pseudomonas sp. Marseille-P9899 TaxID=2730401 RepID=UPI00158A2823|nr:histidine phosphatase family protein [Pseudomonas sp. Marseille-P9899]
MSSLLLLRHGQAAFGADDYDSLSPLGVRQAEATGVFFAEREMAFDAVYVGPRHRHRDTARSAVSDAGLLAVPALDEFAEGDVLLAAARRELLARGEPWPEDRAAQLRHYGAQLRHWSTGTATVAGATPLAEFGATVGDWLDSLRQGVRGQRLLAVTSAGTIALLACRALWLPDNRVHELLLALDNASLSEIVFDAQRLSLRVFNSTAHLPAALASRI